MIKNEVILSAIYMIQDYSKGSHFLEETVDRVLTELKLLDKELDKQLKEAYIDGGNAVWKALEGNELNN